MRNDFRGLYGRRDYGSSDWDYADQSSDEDDDYCSSDEEEYDDEPIKKKPYPRPGCRAPMQGQSAYGYYHDPRRDAVPEAYDSPYYDDKGRSAIDPRMDPREIRRYGPQARKVSVAKRYEDELKRRQEENCVQDLVANAYYAQKPKPAKCPTNHSATSLKACDHQLKFSASFQGVQTFYVPDKKPVPKEASLANDARYAAIYMTPEQLRVQAYEYRLAQGREGNPYTPEAMNARQGLAQFLSCDFAPRKGDPYTRPVAKPMRGKTLAQAKVDMRLPRPLC